MANSNKLPLWLRWWGIAAGGVTIFWLPVEDTTSKTLVLISAMWGIWLASWSENQSWFRLRRLPESWHLVIKGVLTGLLLPLAALLLVLIKAGLHGHGFLDFSLFQLKQILVRTPLWMGLGGLGAGVLGIFKPRF